MVQFIKINTFYLEVCIISTNLISIKITIKLSLHKKHRTLGEN
ncbi:MAG: hypothetical protein ACI9N3_002799 [Colwellia sp.]|jgi:hypothetical protein